MMISSKSNKSTIAESALSHSLVLTRAMAEAQGRRRSLSSSSPRIVQDATRAVATELRTVSGVSVVVEFHIVG